MNRGDSLGTHKMNKPHGGLSGARSTTQSSRGAMPVNVRRRGQVSKAGPSNSAKPSSFGDTGSQVSAAGGHGDSVGYGNVSAPANVGGAAEAKSIPLQYHGGEDRTAMSENGTRVKRREVGQSHKVPMHGR